MGCCRHWRFSHLLCFQTYVTEETMKFTRVLLVLVVLFMLVMIGLSFYDSYRSSQADAGESSIPTEETATEAQE